MINIETAYPLFVTNNLSDLKDYYSENFGFEAVFFEPNFYLHLLHSESGQQLGFLMPDHPSQPAFLHSATSNIGSIITFEVPSAKDAWQIAKDTGLNIVLDYTEESWGQNHLLVRDPQGLMIDLVENVQQ